MSLRNILSKILSSSASIFLALCDFTQAQILESSERGKSKKDFFDELESRDLGKIVAKGFSDPHDKGLQTY